MNRNILKNEKGVVLIVALLILLVLTLIGISAVNTSIFEINISGNARVGTDAFYASEAGTQVGINQLPNTTAISRTKLGEDSYYRGSLQSFGLHQRVGFDSSWSFKRYQVNGTGESLGATKEIEVQVSYGPFTSGTSYNN